MADTGQGFLEALANLSTFGGSTAGNMAKGLIEQAKLQQEQDRIGLQRTNTGVNVGNLGIAQKAQALGAPGQLARQSVQGDILSNGKDFGVSGLNPKINVPTMTGGLRPSMLSDSSRTLGANESRNALADQVSGKYTNLAPLPTVPDATPLPEARLLQNLLAKTGIAAGAASTVGGILDALKKAAAAKGSSGGGSGGSGGSSGGGNGGSTHGGDPNWQGPINENDPNAWDPTQWQPDPAGDNAATGGTAYYIDENGNKVPLPIGGGSNTGGTGDSGGYYDADGNWIEGDQ